MAVVACGGRLAYGGRWLRCSVGPVVQRGSSKAGKKTGYN